MSDTSLVFNIIARDSGVGRALSAVQRAFRGAGQEAESSLNAASQSTQNLDRMLSEARARVVSLSQEFERTGDKTLFGQISRDRSLISNLERVRSTLRTTTTDADRAGGELGSVGGIFSRVAGAAGSLGGALGGLGNSFGSALPPMGQMIALAGGLTAGMFALPGAIYAVGAAAASLPGLLSGGIAALFTLKMGLSGLSENWKAMNAPSAGGGGGGGGGSAPKVDMTPKIRAVEAAQRQVAKSTRDITDAQGDLREATAGVNKAREEERERIDDVRRSLASARADEEDSVQSLAEARMDLASAEQRGNPDEIRRAQIAVDKQAASLAEARDKTQDLQKESTDAARKGVEGSDAVIDAKKREKDAQRAVSDAIAAHKLALQQLGDAQKSLNEKIAGAGAAVGGGGGLGVQLPKIAKSAQAFLDELKRLKPAFDDLRLEIQEKLFAGLAEKLHILAMRWLPALHTGLGKMADMMNGVVKTAFDSLSDKDFIKNTMIGVDAVRIALGKVGQAIAGPLIDAWGRLSKRASPFIIMLGDKLAGIITQFSNWIAKMDDSGRLTAFFEKATSIVGSLFDIFTNLARIAGSVISILFGTQGGSTDAWQNLANLTDKIADWLGNPKTQANIALVIDAIFGLWQVFKWLAAGIGDAWNKGGDFIRWCKSAATSVRGFFGALSSVVVSFFNRMGSQLAALPGRIWGWLKNIPTVVRTAVNNALAWFQQLGTRAYNAVANMGSYVWNALSGLASMFYNAGYNAILGIWNGMGSLTNWLWSKVQNIGISMWNAFMNGIGAHSPSVKFANAARFAMLGAGKGFDENTPWLMSKVYGIADQLAGVKLGLGLDDMSLADQLGAAASAVTVQAVNRTQRVQVDLNVIGSDGMIKTALQKLNRTSNLKLV